MKVKPTENRVLIKPDKEPGVTKGGIHLPDNAKEKPMRGKVLAVGPGKVLPNGTRSTMEVKVGDTVLYPKFVAYEIKVDEEDLLVIPENEILAIEG
jgi:chaperonin GroES